MEIRLGKKYESETEDTRIEFLDELTQGQFDKLQFSISQIEELNNTKRLLDFVLTNDNEVVDFINQSEQTLTWMIKSMHILRRANYDNVYSNINRLLLNYLSSIKIFVDHLETFINRKFGDKSYELTEFKKLLSSIYDNNFSYRFFIKLRNYTQHVGLPIHNMFFSTYFEQKERLSLKGHLKVSFNRDRLLSEFTKWGSVKGDLEKEEERFDLIPQLNEATRIIIELERNVVQLLKPGLTKSIENIKELIGHLQIDSGEIFIAYNIQAKNNGEIANYESIMIPFEAINFIEREFKTSV